MRHRDDVFADSSKKRLASLALLITVTSLVGCAHYQVGTESLYAPDVQTVFVPMIESDSFRRDLGERLTEAVVREIELKTPYKVVGSPDADAILSVHLLGDSRRVLVEDQFDLPRALENTLQAEVSFINRRRVAFEPATAALLEIPPELIVTESAVMVPVLGQTVTSSQQQAIDRLAQAIVGRMEQPW